MCVVLPFSVNIVRYLILILWAIFLAFIFDYLYTMRVALKTGRLVMNRFNATAREYVEWNEISFEWLIFRHVNQRRFKAHQLLLHHKLQAHTHFSLNDVLDDIIDKLITLSTNPPGGDKNESRWLKSNERRVYLSTAPSLPNCRAWRFVSTWSNERDEKWEMRLKT